MQFLTDLMKSKTFLIAAIVVAGVIAESVWRETESGWWTAGVAIVGGVVAGGVIAFLAGKAAAAWRARRG